MSVVLADCIEVMAGMEPDSIDAICTDPPYGLSFMGKGWDDLSKVPAHTGPQWGGYGWHGQGPPAGAVMYDFHHRWATAALRVAKPGAYLLAFGGDRTVHRLACAIEDAGWIIKGMLIWGHAQGFPKGRNVTRDLEQAVPEGARCACGPRSTRTAQGSPGGYRPERGSNGERPRPAPGSGLAAAPSQADAPARSHDDPRADDPASGLGRSPAPAGNGHPSNGYSQAPAWPPSEVAPPGDTPLSDMPSSMNESGTTESGSKPSRTLDTSGSASGSGPSSWVPPSGTSAYYKCTSCGLWAVYQGLNTALKPAFEPIVWAQKPMVGTYAKNVARHGTGALNIEDTRIPGPMDGTWGARQASSIGYGGTEPTDYRTEMSDAGRYPSNLLLTAPIFDGGWDGVVGGGETTSGGGDKGNRPGGSRSDWFGARPASGNGFSHEYDGDTGTYSRFFLISKAPTSERIVDGERSPHPTQKPEALIRHLVKLVTPADGVVLDPFLGSGTLGVVCDRLGIRWIGIEREPEYAEWARRRVEAGKAEWERLPA